MNLLQGLYQVPLVPQYSPGKLDERTLRVLLGAANRIPHFNVRHDCGFVVIQNAEVLRRGSAMIQSRQSKGEVKEGEARGGLSLFHGSKTLILVCAKSQSLDTVESCLLSGQNLLLAAYAMGLASCPIALGVEVYSDPEVRELFSIPSQYIPVFSLAVGFPALWTDKPTRGPVQILSWKK